MTTHFIILDNSTWKPFYTHSKSVLFTLNNLSGTLSFCSFFTIFRPSKFLTRILHIKNSDLGLQSINLNVSDNSTFPILLASSRSQAEEFRADSTSLGIMDRSHRGLLHSVSFCEIRSIPDSYNDMASSGICIIDSVSRLGHGSYTKNMFTNLVFLTLFGSRSRNTDGTNLEWLN